MGPLPPRIGWSTNGWMLIGSYAVGAAATGLVEACLMLITPLRFAAVAAGPIGWAAFAVGTAVSFGVGQLIEHHWSD